MNSHRAVVNRLRWMQAEYRLTTADRVLQKTPFSFDVSVWELFWPLLVGAMRLGGRARRERITATATLTYLVDLIEHHARGVTTLALRAVDAAGVPRRAVGGARCCDAHARSLRAARRCPPGPGTQRFFDGASGGRAFHNLYGPTEAAVDVSHFTCKPHDPRARLRSTGKPDRKHSPLRPRPPATRSSRRASPAPSTSAASRWAAATTAGRR